MQFTEEYLQRSLLINLMREVLRETSPFASLLKRVHRENRCAEIMSAWLGKKNRTFVGASEI